ncbi:alpha/beta-hydrolase [Marasmius fiardii PR-910]|nr:alpha/beta-hydrolase [Marasmius fiardii PR-910]
MATDTSSSDELEKFLTLPDGRTLAYADSGNRASPTIVIFFHGFFGIGRSGFTMEAFRESGFHIVTPTLPGFGLSSPRDKTLPYAVYLSRTITALIDHLHPNEPNLRIYMSGGSYGTVPAQILYGLPFDVFPYGKNIVGCMILAPLSPFRHDVEYTKGMTWTNWVGVGPPSQLVPFHLLQRLVAKAIGMKIKTVDKAEAFLRKTLFETATEAEKASFLAWKEREGIPEGQWERKMAENMVKSFATTWDGFYEGSDVLHSDWGFDPRLLDEEHTKRPLMAVASSSDPLGPHMATWINENYPNSTLKWLDGGHIAATYVMSDLWRELFTQVEGTS